LPVSANEDGKNSNLTGLSKREIFAMAAMQGLMATDDKGEFNSIEDSCAEAARIAVIAADALLNELSKTQP
jgi:hypothetical protein